MVLTYWGRTLFISELLPLLTTPRSTEIKYTPRIITIFSTGVEDVNSLHLDDLDLREPGHMGIMPFIKTCASMITSFMARAAQENPSVVFIHSHPGAVKTTTTQNGWGKKTWGPYLMRVLIPMAIIFGIVNPETSGESNLYLMTSAEYGGDGVALSKGVEQGCTADDPKNDKLFCVNRKMACWKTTEFLRQMKLKGADEIVWNKTFELFKNYL